MSEPRQHFFESQRLRLCYWEWGDPANPPLLLHHGGRDTARSWDRIAVGFEDAYRVLALDLRGHGDSQPEVGGEYSIRQNVIDLLALADLAGPPVFLLGHSYGGRIGYLAAGAFPERFRAIVSIEGPLEPSHGDPKPFTPELLRSMVETRQALVGRRPRTYADLEEAATRMRENNPRLSAEHALDLAGHAAVAADGGYQWKFDNWARPGVRRDDVSAEEMKRFTAAISCPLLLIVGEDSGGRRRMQDQISLFPNGRSVLVPDAAHWVHHDQPATVIREARAWFEEAAAAGG